MLVYFSAVCGLSTPDGNEYLKPHRFIPVLAKLIYCSRLVFLEAVLPRSSRNYEGAAHLPRHRLLEGLMQPAANICVMALYRLWANS
ncbi:hypothetical protein IWW34DRAFT_751824 [Fusarium oxysporum f. sp. albedinis]|nr:hypothetical protein IWW34DRAFT_751824 [Fusarium oxysporum f. sp. albedinis]